MRRVMSLVWLVACVSFSSSVWAFNLDHEIQRQERQSQQTVLALRDREPSAQVNSARRTDDSMSVRLMSKAEASRARKSHQAKR